MMDKREMHSHERLVSIENTLHEIVRRLEYLDKVQIPFIYNKLKVVEREQRTLKRSLARTEPLQQLERPEPDVHEREIPVARLVRNPIAVPELTERIPREPVDEVSKGIIETEHTWSLEGPSLESREMEEDVERKTGVGIGFEGKEDLKEILGIEDVETEHATGEEGSDTGREGVSRIPFDHDQERLETGFPGYVPASHFDRWVKRRMPVLPTMRVSKQYGTRQGMEKWEQEARLREAERREEREVEPEKRALQLELYIGGKWALRIGLFFILLGFFIWGYFIKTLEPWEKALLFFLCGGGLITLGEYIYVEKKKLLQKHLSSYGVWLVIGGIEVVYLGAWRTYSVYHLTDFRFFILLILSIVAMNVVLSIRHQHHLMILQYMTTFYLTCVVVFIEYAASDPYFPVLFLIGTSLLIGVDITWRSADYASITLGYSSLFLFILIGQTGDIMPYLLTGYLLILITASLFYRKIDTLLGFGKTPDLFWGFMLTLCYLHALIYLLKGGEERVFPGIFALITVGMLCTYFIPNIITDKKSYRFATDLEFYFITGIFFFIFYTISPNVLLLPVLLVSGCFIGFFNLAPRKILSDDIPQLLDSTEYLVIGPRRNTLYLLDNRTRTHVFLFIIVSATTIGLVWMNVSATVSAAYLMGFLSMTAVLGVIAYRRSEEDALHTLRTPIYSIGADELEKFEFSPNSYIIDRSLYLHLPGIGVNFMVVCISLFVEYSVLTLVPFIIYVSVILILNKRYAWSLAKRLIKHASSAESGINGVHDLLNKSWIRSTGMSPSTIMLIWTGVFTILAGITMPHLAVSYLIFYLAVIVLIRLESEHVRKMAFLIQYEGSTDDYPGLIPRNEGYLPYLPFIPLIFTGGLEFMWVGQYGLYFFFLMVYLIERFFYPQYINGLNIHILSLIIIGIWTSPYDYSGFVFLLACGLIMYLDKDEISRNARLYSVLPIIVLYTARVIANIKGMFVPDVVADGELPPLYSVTLELLIFAIFLKQFHSLFRENKSWRGPNESGRQIVYPRLLALLILIPISYPQLHLNVIIIPAGVLYLSLKMNAPVENFVSYVVFIFAFGHMMSSFLSGIVLDYAVIGLFSMYLALSILIDYREDANDASIGMFWYSCGGLLFMSVVAFTADVRTTSSWALMSLIVITCGIGLEKRYMRYTGMFIAGLTITKILFIDLMNAPPMTRVASLIFTGFCLLSIAYLYFWYRDKIEKELVATTEK